MKSLPGGGGGAEGSFEGVGERGCRDRALITWQSWLRNWAAKRPERKKINFPCDMCLEMIRMLWQSF